RYNGNPMSMLGFRDDSEARKNALVAAQARAARDALAARVFVRPSPELLHIELHPIELVFLQALELLELFGREDAFGALHDPPEEVFREVDLFLAMQGGCGEAQTPAGGHVRILSAYARPCVVLVRGIFGRSIPACHRAPRQAFRRPASYPASTCCGRPSRLLLALLSQGGLACWFVRVLRLSSASHCSSARRNRAPMRASLRKPS